MWDKRYLRTEFHKSGISFFPARRIWSHRIIYPRSTKSNCRNDFCLLWGIVQQPFVCMFFFNGSILSSEMLQNVGFLEWSNCKVQIASVLVWVSRCFIKVHFTGITTTTSVNSHMAQLGACLTPDQKVAYSNRTVVKCPFGFFSWYVPFASWG